MIIRVKRRWLLTPEKVLFLKLKELYIQACCIACPVWLQFLLIAAIDVELYTQNLARLSVLFWIFRMTVAS